MFTLVEVIHSNERRCPPSFSVLREMYFHLSLYTIRTQRTHDLINSISISVTTFNFAKIVNND